MVLDKSNLSIYTACIRIYYNVKKATNISTFPESMDTTDEINFDTNEQFTLKDSIFDGSGHKHCVLCSQKIAAGVMIIPKAVRLDLLIYYSIYVPDSVRCCKSYILNN